MITLSGFKDMAKPIQQESRGIAQYSVSQL